MPLTKSSNLLISCITPIIWPNEFFIAIHKIDLCLNDAFSSTLESNLGSSYACGMLTVYERKEYKSVNICSYNRRLIIQLWWMRVMKKDAIKKVSSSTAYLTSCCNMSRYTNIYGKTWLKRTSSFIEIIISFKIEYTWKTSFGCFM